MTTIKRDKLKTVLNRVPAGAPVTSKDLAALGVSADLAVHYARAGWLERLARGVFRRPEAPLQLESSLKLLERQIAGLHVAGRTALEWHGIKHFVRSDSTLELYGWEAAALPEWFTDGFAARYRRKRLFEESPSSMLHVSELVRRPSAPLVSEPERALLELLSAVGVSQTLDEARLLVESTYGFRSGALRSLLSRCTSVKTVRLCLTLGSEHAMPWAKKLDPRSLPTGSGKPWVSRSAGGLLVLKP